MRTVVRNGIALRKPSQYNERLCHVMPGSKEINADLLYMQINTTRTYMSRSVLSPHKAEYLDAFAAIVDEYDLSEFKERYFGPNARSQMSAITIAMPDDMKQAARDLKAMFERGGLITCAEGVQYCIAFPYGHADGNGGMDLSM